MPRYNVEADGEWACFSSVVDAFICPFMPKAEYEVFRKLECGNECLPLERSNRLTLKEAIFKMSLNRSDADFIKCLREANLIYQVDPEEVEG